MQLVTFPKGTQPHVVVFALLVTASHATTHLMHQKLIISWLSHAAFARLLRGELIFLFLKLGVNVLSGVPPAPLDTDSFKLTLRCKTHLESHMDQETLYLLPLGSQDFSARR